MLWCFHLQGKVVYILIGGSVQGFWGSGLPITEHTKVGVQVSEQMVPSVPTRQKVGLAASGGHQAAAAAAPEGGWDVLQVHASARGSCHNEVNSAGHRACWTCLTISRA